MSADSHVDSDELDPDEPRTPMWLPLLGGALFLGALLVFLATRSEDESAQAQDATVAAASPADDGEDAADDPGQDDRAPARAAPPAPAPAPAPAQPAAGEPDAFQRKPGDEHYGHDHP